MGGQQVLTHSIEQAEALLQLGLLQAFLAIGSVHKTFDLAKGFKVAHIAKTVITKVAILGRCAVPAAKCARMQRVYVVAKKGMKSHPFPFLFGVMKSGQDTGGHKPQSDKPTYIVTGGQNALFTLAVRMVRLAGIGVMGIDAVIS